MLDQARVGLSRGLEEDPMTIEPGLYVFHGNTGRHHWSFWCFWNSPDSMEDSTAIKTSYVGDDCLVLGTFGTNKWNCVIKCLVSDIVCFTIPIEYFTQAWRKIDV